MKNIFFRLYQYALYVAAFFLPWRQPRVIQGTESMDELAKYFIDKKVNKVLVVADKNVIQLKMPDEMFEKLTANGIGYVVYDKNQPNPTINNVEEALGIYKAENCNGIVAFGGGSNMDCAKCVGARVVRPKRKVENLKGLFKVGRKLPPLAAVPTTSGTGSEVTLAAVITDSETHHKYPINDPVLVPDCAVLDPKLTVSLPPHLTSTTGMDALCHAVEAYIGNSNTRKTKREAEEAVKLIFDNLQTAYNNPTDTTARANMQRASFLAGLAFTRAYVGNIHAIAHALGGKYLVPHGLANAVVMPYVLKRYGSSAHKKLAKLADIIGITTAEQTDEQKAVAFISAISQLNAEMNIPNKVQQIKQEDIAQMADYAYAEANPLYPVPTIFSRKDFIDIFTQLMP